MDPIVKSFEYGSEKITLETGKIARQADAAVLVNMSDTVVLATVVGNSKDTPQSFLPLTVNYQERTYSAGKIPGGFFKREGRPSEKETLISRLIDRSMRPLFPEGFYDEVQIIVTLLSLNPEVSPDIPAMIGASAALSISGIPFEGPIAAARVGLKDGSYILNPQANEMKDSVLDLVVAGTDKAVMMVESEAQELSEAKMLGAVNFGYENMQVAINAITEFAESNRKKSWDWTPVLLDKELVEQCQSQFTNPITTAYQIREKLERQNKIAEIKQQAIEQLAADDEEKASAVKKILSKIEKTSMRQRILDGESRIDGRDTRTVRPIYVETGQLPRNHGNALFTRGETQVLAVTTLGTGRDAQIIDDLCGEYKDHFMFHYNFPPYCVGETGFIGSPKRREIGHGRLAKRGLLAVMPGEDVFPYVIRLVSEVTESNGSSSMGSVCAASLALMDAGVPIKAPVSGIAMGLILEDNRFAILSDIMGDEDHFGDMDFKVAGTENGVTALQMDIKVTGVSTEIMESALEQAREGRLHILGEMNKVLSIPKEEMSQYAPRMLTIKVHPDKIRDIIGKGGATIRSLTEETGAVIDIDDDGNVVIASNDEMAGAEAKRRIEEIVADVEIGKIYNGKVAKIVDFGAFVTILPGRDGLLHISQISKERVEKVTDWLNEGDDVQVKVLDKDRQGRIKLSMKEIENMENNE